MKFAAKAPRRMAGVEMTSLMDFVFLLLCFFVTASSFSEWETETILPLELPDATSAEMPKRMPGEIILNVDQSGSVSVNGRYIGADELKGVLARLAKYYPGQSVVIRADKESTYENVVDVIDSCRSAGIWNFSLATKEK